MSDEQKPSVDERGDERRQALRDLDVNTKDADQVKGGAKRREDPCAGGE
jgi:hypothetical protein